MIWLIIVLSYVVSYILTYFIVKWLFIYSMDRYIKKYNLGAKYKWNESGADRDTFLVLSIGSIITILVVLASVFILDRD